MATPLIATRGMAMRTIFGSLLVIGLLTGGGAYYVLHASADPPAKFRTVPVKRGDLISTITATGTVEPQEVVDVGAQVTGPVKELGKDPSSRTKCIDYRSEVEKGQLLAKIDPSVYLAEREQARANVELAKANMGQLLAHLAQCKAEFKRADRILPKLAIARTDYDVEVANFKVAEANVNVGKAAVKQSEAALAMAQRNLDYCTIKSPVKGTIIDRRISVGQTVVSSMTTSSLFLIAKDLRKMLIWASVNEADIGRIHQGMPVQFAVDAYPNETFHGTVAQIRYNATMTQNVVTYTVVVTADNSDLRLLPYLTANLSFQVQQHPNVLYVPNGVLRWKPRLQDVLPEFRDRLRAEGDEKPERAEAGRTVSKENTSPSKAANPQAPPELAKDADLKAVAKVGQQGSTELAKRAQLDAAAKPAKTHHPTRAEHGQVWVKDGDGVRPIEVRIGASDGISTEIHGESVNEGMEVVLGYAIADESATTTNPFAPKLFRRKGGEPKARL